MCIQNGGGPLDGRASLNRLFPPVSDCVGQGVDMAQCAQSVQEFVQGSFVPMVASLCSDEAERVTRKNNLTFEELLRPFCRLTSEGKLQLNLVCGDSESNDQLLTVGNRGHFFSPFLFLDCLNVSPNV